MDGSTWVIVQNIFLALGGLGLFLLGLKMMSDGLKNIAGSRMRTIIGKATANRFLGLLVGMVTTAVTQSSTATSIMSIGFVNAGLMNLKQFTSIIIGASIGTTFTAFLFSFRIDSIAPLFIFLGICLYLFVKKKKVKSIGFIVLGLGILFFGLSTMGAPLFEFSRLDGFQRMLLAFANPLLALLTGVLFTAIVQSSTATIGVIIAMYLSGVDLSFTTAAFLVLGANIGTCSTALLSSLAADRESKRAALILAVYKITAGSAFAVAISVVPGILPWFQERWADGAVQIAMFHTAYNLVAATVMIFFTGRLVSFVYRLLPKLPAEDSAMQLMHLGKESEQTPAITFTQAHSELCRMGRMAAANLELALKAFFERNAEKAVEVFETEGVIDYLKREITAYLMRIQSTKLTSTDVERLSAMLKTVSDIERLGDHAENIAEYVLNDWSSGISMSPEATKELGTLSKAMMDTLAITLESYEVHDLSRIGRIHEMEQEVDDLSAQYLDNHIGRLDAKRCDPRCSVIFTSMVSDLERCSDHAINIAENILPT
ncbi:MAG: Na/Pi cotransporter family protein [Oscillospiraceae bacterium]|nr:Na/Pi cotransporter family protein [Oscillospiraceae bacterium]